jgi:hypothetical protein
VSAPAPAAVQAEPAERRAGRSHGSDADAHLLRLCLDLQVDALLLTLGAAAAGQGAASTSPWIRWVSEDVQTACALAADVMDGGASLPTVLGTDLDHAAPTTALDNLVARYESMASLLADVLSPARARPAGPERPGVREALRQCERRLGELRANQPDGGPPRELHLP